MVSKLEDKAAFFQDQYVKLQKTFSTFNELLTKGNNFGLDFQLVDSKVINSKMFGEQIQISFTVSSWKKLVFTLIKILTNRIYSRTYLGALKFLCLWLDLMGRLNFILLIIKIV